MIDKENSCLNKCNQEISDYSFDDDTAFSEDGIFSLIRQDSRLDRGFSEYCRSHEIRDHDLSSVCEWAGAGIGNWKYAEEHGWEPSQVSLKQAVAEILSAVLLYKEGFGFLEAGYGSNGRASLQLIPIFPWDMNEREKSLTREEGLSVIEKYVRMVSDDGNFHRFYSIRTLGGEYVDGIEGAGICLEDMLTADPEPVQIVDLIRQAPEVYKSFLQYCSAHNIRNANMHDFTGWIGCEQANYAIAVILSKVIAERENVFFIPASVRVIYSGEISTFLVFEEKNPWEYTDEEKKLTFEDWQGILEDYTAFISDDMPHVWRIDFGKYGY